ncbi:DNA adenine methylase [Rothia dentocariosa]|uniref:DNA adenine methylase n=1 Tax=Rothia dentocariosa TaxID=2047 RepID=UPI00214BAE6E|nr:DNA adenine methylase [Rothia dentocariosa]
MALNHLSPLRYPGGKSRLAPYISELIRCQEYRPTSYAEPFAGGAGAALKLLANEAVKTIYINDLSPGIAAFWRSVFNCNKEFVAKIYETPITMDKWYEQRDIFKNPEKYDDITLGFATFFLNRCNRSGILTAGPIGGMNQSGKWKIDARFNRPNLADKITFLGNYNKRVSVTQLDAKEFMKSIEPEGDNVFFYVDPPYIVQGEQLYLNSLTYQDHIELAEYLHGVSAPWILTYDVVDQVTDDLYKGLRVAEFDISHTAQKQHIGSEYIVYGENVKVPNLNMLVRANGKWVHG